MERRLCARSLGSTGGIRAGRIRNLVGGEWKLIGMPGKHVWPVDGVAIPGPPRISHVEAVIAVTQAAEEHKAWAATDLDERTARVSTAVEQMRAERDALALLLVWEIGKPWRTACADVDRALDGADWYLGEIERQLQGRSALHGPVSNIASWNYPMSVQVHGELLQLLAGAMVASVATVDADFGALVVESCAPSKSVSTSHALAAIGRSLRRQGRIVEGRLCRR